MPKFLDAPSWYDTNGNILSAEGRYVINLTSEDFDIQSSAGTARATVNISNLPYGTKGVIYSPSETLATMQYIEITASSNQTVDLEFSYSMTTFPYTSYGIFFTISHQTVDMNGKTIIFENATINQFESGSYVRLYPSIIPNPVEVVANGITGTVLPMATGVKVGYFNGNTSNYSNVNFYAPTTSGSSGQLLQSSGAGAPTWMANGEEGQFLRMGSTMPIWDSFTETYCGRLAASSWTSSTQFGLTTILPSSPSFVIVIGGSFQLNSMASLGSWFMAGRVGNNVYIASSDGTVQSTSTSSSIRNSGNSCYFWIFTSQTIEVGSVS